MMKAASDAAWWRDPAQQTRVYVGLILVATGLGIVVPAGASSLSARRLGAEMRWRSRMSVWIDVIQAGQTVRSVLVPIDVSIHAKHES